NKNRARASNLLTSNGFRVLSFKQWQNIINMNRFAVDNGTTSGRASSEWPLASSDRHWSIYSYVLKDIAIDSINQSISGIAQLRGCHRDRIEYRLDVGR